ncbi:hypothetical protein Tco_1157913 [Tanacetum coccineum]
MVNHNDVLDDDDDEPLNENDHDNEDELNNIDEGEELNAHHLVLAQSGVDIVGTDVFGGANHPTSYAANLEIMAFPQIEDVVCAVKRA